MQAKLPGRILRVVGKSGPDSPIEEKSSQDCEATGRTARSASRSCRVLRIHGSPEKGSRKPATAEDE